MGVLIDVADGQIDVGDDKDITVVAEDPSGTAVQLSAIDLILTPADGSASTYDINDFAVSSNEYTLTHEFRTEGQVEIDCTVTDMSSKQERVTGSEYVHA